MDRDRLKDVQTSDLKESRVNEDFVGFLKKHGPAIALAVLVPVAGTLFYYNFRDSKAREYDAAFQALAESRLPEAFEEVAESYTDVGTVALQARLRAGQAFLNAVRIDMTLEDIAAAQVTQNFEPTEESALNDDQREIYLKRADDFFSRVITDLDTLEAGEPQPAHTIFAVTALSGRAAVADARGNAEDAKALYTTAAERAGDDFPHLRDNQLALAADIESRGAPRPWSVTQTSSEGPTLPTAAPRMLLADPALQSIALPDEGDADDAE